MAHILVVEDHSVTQRLLSKRLQDAGHAVELAGDGLEGLAVLAETPVDLIISDIAMPNMDGMTFLQQVRAIDQTRTVPFIVLTTSVLDHHRQEAEEAGANGFLEKPVSSWELINLVNRLLEEAAP